MSHIVPVAKFDINTDQAAFYAEIRRKFSPQPRPVVIPRREDTNAVSDQAAASVAKPFTLEMLLSKYRLYFSSFDKNGDNDRVKLDDIMRQVSIAFGVSVPDLKSGRRSNSLVIPRHAFFFLASKLTPCSLPQMGRHCGDRDHTTALNSIRRCAEIMNKDEAFCEIVRAIAGRLGGVV